MTEADRACDRIERVAACEAPTEMQRRRLVFDAEVLRGTVRELAETAVRAERARREAEEMRDRSERARAEESAMASVRTRRRCAEMRRDLSRMTMAELRRLCQRECISPGYAGSRKDTLVDAIIKTRTRREEMGI